MASRAPRVEMLVSSSSVSGVLFGLSWPILQCLCLSLYVNGFLACDLFQSLTALCCPEDGSRSHGLNLFQGFDGRMEAKLMREKLMLKGRVTFVDEAMRRGINSPGPVYEQKVRLNIIGGFNLRGTTIPTTTRACCPPTATTRPWPWPRPP